MTNEANQTAPTDASNAPSLEEEILRPSKLSPVDYELERNGVAERFGIRVTTLEKPEHIGPVVDPERALDELAEAVPDKSKKAADVLIELSARAEELFHAPDGKAYATIPVGDHCETWPIRSKGFRRWLAREFFTKTSSAPNSDAIQSALNVIEARAHFDGAQRPVHIRVGAHDGRLYLDLADVTDVQREKLRPDLYRDVEPQRGRLP